MCVCVCVCVVCVCVCVCVVCVYVVCVYVVCVCVCVCVCVTVAWHLMSGVPIVWHNERYLGFPKVGPTCIPLSAFFCSGTS